MSESWGGARTPGSPAAVSGPGALSARTDGGVMNPNSPSYGEGATLETLKAGAPMGAPPSGGTAPAPGGGVDLLAAVTGFDAPSARPDEPVTAGASAGAGPGLEALGLPLTPEDERQADVKALGPGAINALVAASQRADATPSFRRLVRKALYF